MSLQITSVTAKSADVGRHVASALTTSAKFAAWFVLFEMVRASMIGVKLFRRAK